MHTSRGKLNVWYTCAKANGVVQGIAGPPLLFCVCGGGKHDETGLFILGINNPFMNAQPPSPTSTFHISTRWIDDQATLEWAWDFPNAPAAFLHSFAAPQIQVKGGRLLLVWRGVYVVCRSPEPTFIHTKPTNSNQSIKRPTNPTKKRTAARGAGGVRGAGVRLRQRGGLPLPGLCDRGGERERARGEGAGRVGGGEAVEGVMVVEW